MFMYKLNATVFVHKATYMSSFNIREKIKYLKDERQQPEICQGMCDNLVMQ